MNLMECLRRSAARLPDVEAVVDDQVRWSYRDLVERVESVASHLRELGIKAGDHVLVVLKNRRENILIYWACHRIGAIYTPVNFRMSVDELSYCATDSQCRLVVAEAGLEDTVRTALKGLAEPVPVVWVAGVASDPEAFDQWLTPGTNPLPDVAVEESQTAIMLYTSGTTGKPKGVPRSHRNEISAAVAHIIQNRYQMGERSVGAMPFYHTMGMRSLVSSALLNGALALLPDYETERLARLIPEERITALYLVPTLFYDLVNWRGLSELDLRSLTKIGYAGAAMTSALTAQCFERLVPDVFVNHFGSSEVYTFTICDWLDRKPTCAGKAGFHSEVRVVAINETSGSPDDRVAPGAPGEVIVRLTSPEAFQGYWNRPEATAKAIRQGWYYTGDVGYWDDDGDLWVYGRVDDMLISGGENIHPLEVEDVLSLHPGVAEVAVVGRPDDRWGEVVTAFIVPRDPNLTQEALDQYCQDATSLARFKRPRQYIFVKEIPKSPVGKILRRVLRERPLDTK